MPRTTILIAENSCLIRKGLYSLLQHLENSEVIQSFDNKDDLFEFINQSEPDILIINPEILHAKCSDIKKSFPNAHKMFLVLISSDKEIHKKCKADAYIHYGDQQDKILDLLQEAISQINKNPFPNKNNETLSSREKNILKHIALGLTNKDIADQLFISIHTVVTHRKNITQKLGIKSVSGLTVYAILNNLISMDEIK